MSSYAGLDEQGLRKLLDTSSDITERRKIRAALRELRANNNNVAHPHFRTPASISKLSHHQSFRYERRRRPENDDVTKRSQDDDVLYRSRTRQEMDGRGDENEELDIEIRIKEAQEDEEKLSKLLSETRDFTERRKIRAAIREVKRKKQDESETPSRSQTSSQKREEHNDNVQQENQTNLALSRSVGGQRSSLRDQVTKIPEPPNDVDEITVLQKQLDKAETYEERRRLRTEIRELRQKKRVSSPPTWSSTNTPSYNNNSSNTNSNNCRGRIASESFGTIVKEDRDVDVNSLAIKRDESSEAPSSNTEKIISTDPEMDGVPSLVDDAKEEKKKAVVEEDGRGLTTTPTEVHNEKKTEVVLSGGDGHHSNMNGVESIRDNKESDVDRDGDGDKGSEMMSDVILHTKEDNDVDADDEASRCDSIHTKVHKQVKSNQLPHKHSNNEDDSSISETADGVKSQQLMKEINDLENKLRASDDIIDRRNLRREIRDLKRKMGGSEDRPISEEIDDIDHRAEDIKESEKGEEKHVFQAKSSAIEDAEPMKSEVEMDKAFHVNRNENNANCQVARTVPIVSKDLSKDTEDVIVKEESLDVANARKSVKDEEEEKAKTIVAIDTSEKRLSVSSEEDTTSSKTEDLSQSSEESKDALLPPATDTSHVKDIPVTASTPVLHSPIKSTTKLSFSSSTSPSTSTSETLSSVVEVLPKVSNVADVSSVSVTDSRTPSTLNTNSGTGNKQGLLAALSRSRDMYFTNNQSTSKSSPSPTSPNGGSPLNISLNSTSTRDTDRRLGNFKDDNAIPTPKKSNVSVRRSESAVSSLQAKRQRFLNTTKTDDDTSPTSSTTVRSFKNIVSGNKFAALREKFMASGGNDAAGGRGKLASGSPTTPTTPKSSWQQKPSTSSSPRYSSINEEDTSTDSSKDQSRNRSIYGTPPTTPPTPLPYKTPPTSPLDLKSDSPSSPQASSTPKTEPLKSPTSAQLKYQFLYGSGHSIDGDVFMPDSGSKDEIPVSPTSPNSTQKVITDNKMAPVEQMEDENALEKMLEEATEFDERKKIRARLREIRKKKKDEYDLQIQEQEKKVEERMHKMNVDEAKERCKAVGLNVYTPPGSKSKTVVEESRDGPGGSSSVSMSKTVQQSSSSSSTTGKPMGRPKTKFDEDMEKKKVEREEKRKLEEQKWKEQQQQRRKAEYEMKKKQAEDAKNRKDALMAKFGGSGGGGAGGARPGGGAGVARVQNATTIKQKLLSWAQQVTKGYPGVNITNFSSSWADGLAFCAVIHHYYPNSFDFNTLDSKNRRRNFDLAFDTAEQQASIMPLLETDDMLMMKNNPDWKCVFTYVQSLYRNLNKPQ